MCAALFACLSCTEGFAIGTLDASAHDAPGQDALTPDASPGAFPVDDTDAGPPFDGGPVDGGASSDACAPPWLVTLVRPPDAPVELWRFSLSPESRTRCMPAQPFDLPADARDAEMVDERTAIVAGLGGVVLVDVTTGETLDAFGPPEGEFTELQTIAIGSSTRVGVVAWGNGEGDGRLDRVLHMEAYPQGAAALPLELPESGWCRWPMRVSSYRGEEAATLFLSCHEVYAFSPATGNRTEDLDLPQYMSGSVFHSLPDGTSAGANTLDVTLWRPGQPTRRVSNPCTGKELEAAPDPSSPSAVFFRCDGDLMRYDFEDEELSTTIGGTVEELRLEVVSLGVATGF